MREYKIDLSNFNDGTISKFDIITWLYDNFCTSYSMFITQDELLGNIVFRNIDSYNLFNLCWIINIKENPIISPKFEFNITFDKSKIDKKFYTDRFGPEYENWHVYYTKYCRHLSFKNLEDITLYKLVNS